MRGMFNPVLAAVFEALGSNDNPAAPASAGVTLMEIVRLDRDHLFEPRK
jgi:hypothetical protein